ncbi:amino acid permease [Photobacterium satsumensis]|uniref:amino acid permease n=1 Tax=Photobacterium satsumensis TaxID=2910239 RepID=UPI003D0F1739
MTSNKSAPAKIGVFSFVMITAAVVMSVRTLPMTAQPGMMTIFFTLAAAICFMIPTALVSAELATAWPEDGGIFIWVREAFGERMGFVAVWMQWIQMVFGMTSILMIIGAIFAYAIDPALAENKMYILAVILIIYWGCTFVNMRGVKTLGWVSTLCVILGVFLPFFVLVACAIGYLVTGNPIVTDLSLTSANLIPNFSDNGNWALFIGFVFVVMGMEVSASNVSSVKNAERNYPIAVFLVALFVFLVSVIGSFAIFIGIPAEHISMTAGLIQAFQTYFDMWGLGWLTPVMAVCMAIGLAGQVNSWVLGPVRGIQATANAGALPKILQKTNKEGVPVRLVYLQAILISIVGILITVMPNVDDFYFMLLGLTSLVYIVAYLLMFAAAIYLRYKRPDVLRSFKVPGGKLGMWVCSGLGIATCLLAGYYGFLPPSTYAGTASEYFNFQFIGLVVMAIIPLLVYAWGKKSSNAKQKLAMQNTH